MRKWKTLSRRGLSLLMALTLCAGLLQLPVFAYEDCPCGLEDCICVGGCDCVADCVCDACRSGVPARIEENAAPEETGEDADLAKADEGIGSAESAENAGAEETAADADPVETGGDAGLVEPAEDTPLLAGSEAEPPANELQTTAEELQALIRAARGTLTLDKDYLLDPVVFGQKENSLYPAVTVEGNLVLNMNGHRIAWENLPEDVTSLPGYPVFFNVNGVEANLTITGNGEIDTTIPDNGSYGISVTEGGSLTIENGTFYGAPTAVQVSKGSVKIKGGTFALVEGAKKEDPALNKYLVNAVDRFWKDGSAAIEITGGSFDGFDPSSAPEGAGSSYVPACAVYDAEAGMVRKLTADDDGVVASIGSDYYTSLQAAVDSCPAKDTVKLLADTEEAITISGSDLTLDLAGKKIVNGDIPDSGFSGAITVAGGSLTVDDTSEEQAGQVLGGMFAVVVKDGLLTVENGSFGYATESENWNEPLFVGGGSAVINDGFFFGGTVEYYYYDPGAAKGSLLVNGGRFDAMPLYIAANQGAPIWAPDEDGSLIAYKTYSDFAADNDAFVYDSASNLLKMTKAYAKAAAQTSPLSGFFINGDMILDLNGQSWTMENANEIVVNEETTFTLRDSVGGGVIENKTQAVIETLGTLNIEGGKLEAATWPVISNGNSVIKISGGELRGMYGIASAPVTAGRRNRTILISGGMLNTSGAVFQYLDPSVYSVSITGGTFSQEPNSKYVAEGFVYEGNQVVPQAGVVAAVIDAVGNTVKGCGTLEAAVKACPDGGTVRVLTDVELSGSINPGKAITIEGVTKEDGTKPVVSGAKGLFSFTKQSATVKNLNLQVTGTSWYIYHSAGEQTGTVALTVTECDFTMAEGVFDVGNLIMTEGTKEKTPVIFTNNKVVAHSRAALAGPGDNSVITGNDVDLVSETYGGSRTGVIGLTATENSGTITITNNTFRNANRVLGVDNSAANVAGKLVYEENSFLDCRWALELNPETQNGFDLGKNYYNFDGVVGEARIENSKRDGGSHTTFGDNSTEYKPADGTTPAAVVSSYYQTRSEDGILSNLTAGSGTVARVGEAYFPTLQAAIDAAGTGGTVTLLRDLEESVTIAAGQEIVLDLNDYVLTGKAMDETNCGRENTVTNSGTLTIKDSGSNGTIMGGTDPDTKRGDTGYGNKRNGIAIVNKENATCTIESGTVKRGDNGTFGNYTVRNSGKMYVRGGLITNNSSDSNLLINYNNQSKSGVTHFGDWEDIYMEISDGMVSQESMSAIKNDPGCTMHITGNATVIERRGEAAKGHYASNLYGNVIIDGGTFTTDGYIGFFAHSNSDSGAFPGTFEISGNAKLVCDEIRVVNGISGAKTETAPKLTISGNPDITANHLYQLETVTGGVRLVDASVANIDISGGTFSSPVSPDLCAEGYVPAEKGDGKFGVSMADAVAKLSTGKEYATLDDAIKDAKTGDTVTLLKNAEIKTAATGRQYIAIQGKNITIDLNGQTASGGYLWVYGNYAGLTIQDSSEAQTGKIVGTSYGCRVSGGAGILTVNSGTIEGSTNGIKAESGDVSVTGGTVSGLTAIRASKAGTSLTISGSARVGSTDTSDISTDDGLKTAVNRAAIIVEYGADLKVRDNAQITGNYTGISMWDDGTDVTIEGGRIGAKIYGVTGNGSGDTTNTLTITGGTVIAGDNGVGVYHPQNGNLTIGKADGTGPSITGGTGVQMCAGDTLLVQGGVITATGQDFVTNVSGATYPSGRLPDGGAISAVDRGYPSGDPIHVIITGGTMTAQNGRAIRAYAWDKGADPGESTWENTGAENEKRITISGGSFSSEVPTDYCAVDYVPVKTGERFGVDRTLDLEETAVELPVGERHALAAVTTAAGEEITWRTSDASVAVVMDGVVTAIAEGTATITAAVNGVTSVSCVVTVRPVSVTGVTLTAPATSILVGDTLRLTAEVLPTNAANKGLRWSSDNIGVATVANGVVTGIAAGTATITVTTEDGGFSATQVVTVSPVPVPATGVTLDQGTLALRMGETGRLTATVTPVNTTDSVTWTTSNAGVATVENGVVTGTGTGMATITVTAGGFTATCTVTVTQYFTVTFTAQGRTLSATSYPAGTAAANITVPSVTSYTSGSYRYTFSRWEPAVAAVTANATYTAVYTSAYIGGGSSGGGGGSSSGTAPTRPSTTVEDPDVPLTDVPLTERPAQFTDVAQGSYCYDAVYWAVDQKITNGVSETLFNPNGPCTRAQIVTFLWRAAGSPAAEGSNPFTDVPAGSYYETAVLWAVSKGITGGATATTFNPNAPCTRAQAVTFLYRAAGSPETAGEITFTDVPAGAYYTNAVLWAVSKGVTSGTGAATFAPGNTCTRGQIVTFLHRDRA